ncbi:MAG: 50S ribosomal protein L25 [Chitinivibrionales bacterium]|nr:50S ribosomal protein L25 [Chitinivibrionales bacterium]MBD3356629.1 50S ribosomal protein L25 [Chitinivibrionales bacterium]
MRESSARRRWSLDILKLKTRARNSRGKEYARKSRAGGWLPAVYYGAGMDARSIEIDVAEFGAILRAGKASHLIDLGIGGEEGKSVAIVKEIQRDVITTDHLLHVDFQHVDMSKKVTVQVPVEIAGVPVGVKEDNGILEHSVHHLNIECMPLDIPDHITVDVSGLGMGESLHAGDLSLGEGLVLKDSPDEVLASVLHPTKEPAPEEVVTEEGSAAEGAKG